MSSNTENQRVNFASIKNPMKYPGFLGSAIEVIPRLFTVGYPAEKRKNDGLYKVFAENFPIADTRNNFVLEFLDYYIRPASLFNRRVSGAWPHIQRALEGEIEAVLYLILIMKILTQSFRMFIWVLFRI